MQPFHEGVSHEGLENLTITLLLALMCLPRPPPLLRKSRSNSTLRHAGTRIIFWYAKEQGWDKDEGLDFRSFLPDRHGSAKPSRQQWVFVGGTGSPSSWARSATIPYLIGIANDESWVNAVTVRPDNPALKVKGWNPEYPNLLGSPETVKGKTFLYTQSSSQHACPNT